MSAAAEARQSELDRILDAQTVDPALAADLFAVADLLGREAPLRNALADPTSPASSRRGLATAVLSDRVSSSAVAVVTEAVALNWGSGSRLVTALERQGIRALLGVALAGGRLDTVEDELFRLDRTVAGNSTLRQALDDRAADPSARGQLIADLVSGKVDPVSLELARRAVASTRRSFELTIADYLRLAAGVRQRAIATVTVARPLSEEQQARLRTLLVGQLGREVNLQLIVDPSVLGGARVKVGDEVIEGTVAGRLASAKQQLTQ